MPITLLQLIFFPHFFIVFPNNFPLVRLLTIFRFTVGANSVESEMFREAHDFSFLLNAIRKCKFFCTFKHLLSLISYKSKIENSRSKLYYLNELNLLKNKKLYKKSNCFFYTFYNNYIIKQILLIKRLLCIYIKTFLLM